VTPRAQRVLVILSWCLAGVSVFAAAYGLFAFWAVNAPSLGKHDTGLALFFAFSGAWALLASLWLAPIGALLAVAAWLTRAGSALACLIAALAGAAPFLFMK